MDRGQNERLLEILANEEQTLHSDLIAYILNPNWTEKDLVKLIYNYDYLEEDYWPNEYVRELFKEYHIRETDKTSHSKPEISFYMTFEGVVRLIEMYEHDVKSSKTKLNAN